MAKGAREQVAALSAAIQSHDFLGRLLQEIESLQRVVFHTLPNADWSNVRGSAEQILMAEIVTRHRGDIDGVYFALRAMEAGGKAWAAAIRDLAGYIHSYFTTPLGIIMRQDLFGEEACFLTPEALQWIGGQGRAEAPAPGERS